MYTLLIALLLTAPGRGRGAEVDPLSGGSEGWRFRSASGVRDNNPAAPLFSFANSSPFYKIPAYRGLPASDGCYAAASVTGTKLEALTFTRATTRFCPTDGTSNEATGVMCASGEVCIQTLNGKRGISIFRAGTNLLLRSEEFDNAAWTKDGDSAAPTVTANSSDCGSAPDGTQTAEKVSFPTVAAGGHYSRLRQDSTTASAATGCVWLKRLSGGSTVWLMVGDNDSPSLQRAVVTPGSTWTRSCVATSYVGAAEFTVGFNSYISGGDGSGSAIVVCTWGAGMMQGASYATPYVATAGASATRNAEVASFAVASTASWPISYAVTAVAKLGQVANMTPLAFSNSNSIYSVAQGTNSTTFGCYIANSGTGSDTEAVTFDGDERVACAITASTVQAYYDSVSGGSSAHALSSFNFTAVQVGDFAPFTPRHPDGLLSNVCVDSDPTRCR